MVYVDLKDRQQTPPSCPLLVPSKDLVVDQELLQCFLPYLHQAYNKIFFLELNKLALSTLFTLLPWGFWHSLS